MQICLCTTVQADVAVAKSGGTGEVQVVPVRRGDAAQRLWQRACGGTSIAETLLLLPDGFSLLPGEGILQVPPHHAADTSRKETRFVVLETTVRGPLFHSSISSSWALLLLLLEL